MSRKKTNDRLSIVIATYRNDALLKRCLDSLIEVCCGEEIPEVVVVDDAGGLESTGELVRSYAGRGVKFIEMKSNCGFAGACDAGYRLCTREFVTLVNSDIVFKEYPFDAMVAFMDGNPRTAVLQGTVVLKNGCPGQDGNLDECGSFLTPLGLRLCPTVGGRKRRDAPEFANPFAVYYAYGAFFMCRNGIDKKLGGRFFYDHFHSYYEEADLCHRVWLSGSEVWYVPTCAVEHVHGATISRHCSRLETLRRQIRNRLFCFCTCFGLRGRLFVLPLFQILSFLQSLAALFKGDTVLLKAQVLARMDLRRMRREVRTARKVVQKFRTLTDSQLFKKIMKPYPLRDFFRDISASG